MPTYLYCSLTIESNITIPELLSVEHNKPGFIFSLENAKQQSTDFRWSNYWLSSLGEKALGYDKQGTSHWLRIPGIADFQISANLKEIFCYPLPEIPLETIRHQLLDSVLPRCMAHQGKLMVHASAVRFEQGILILIGDSGTGKSTLAGNFHQAGHPAISDDVVWIKEDQAQSGWAVPSYGGLRLWDDSLIVLFSAEQNILPMAHYSIKKRVLFKQDVTLSHNNGGPILAIVVLTPPNQISHREVYLESLTRRDAFMEILNETYQLDSYNLKERTRRIRTLGRMIPKLRVFRLYMPRDYDLLPLVRQKILEKVL